MRRTKTSKCTICTNCGGSSDSDPTKPETVDNYKPGILGAITAGLSGTLDDHIDERREAKERERQEQIRADWERPHVVTFNSQSAYNNWLRRFGTQIEIVDTTASKRHGLLYSGTLHKTTFTVTFKYKKPESMQPAQAQTQVAAPIPPQQPPALDIPEQIEKLGKLRERGLLTEDEFQSKKQELLSRL